MGSKSKAKELMLQHGVPIVPGYQGTDQSDEHLKKAALEIGLPVLLKATAGGGGKGMRIVEFEQDLNQAIIAAKSESKNAFGDEELIVEKYISSGRHIEFQIFGDKHGNVVHLLERECTIQRRYQKVIEESPSPVLTEDLRNKMGIAAIEAAKALDYDNAGTVEFIYDDITQDFYFLEINTRLQVEHPVTEEITGLDLVQLQIESAEGQTLKIKQTEIRGEGYAIEVRLYAEDPNNNFMPVTGTVQQFKVPEVEGLRVETAIGSGSEVSVFYDPMIAKLIVWDKDRQTAQRKMAYVLRHLICLGTTTNQNFLLQILENSDFRKGIYDTHFIEQNIDLSSQAGLDESHSLASMACTLFSWSHRQNKRTVLNALPSGWRNSFNDYQKEIYSISNQELEVRYRYRQNKFTFYIDGCDYEVIFIDLNDSILRLEIDGTQHTFNIATNKQDFFLHSESLGNLHLTEQLRFPDTNRKGVEPGYEAPMPSQIVKVMIKAGQTIEGGAPLIVLSSMKMENTIYADKGGIIEEVYAQEGKYVDAGFILLKLADN